MDFLILAKPAIGLRGLLLAGFLALPGAPARSQSLPVPCAAGACGPNGTTSWVTSGSATATLVDRQLRVTQLTDTATLNWQSFNIDPGHRVTFDQPSSSAVALNRIFQQDPARILGALDANGRVYLLSRNGILFGEGAQVNVAGLIASTLNITEQAERGIALAANEGAPAFALYRENGATLPSQSVDVENGATLTADGGQIFLFAPTVTNEGEIRTPGGQTILAAGESIFLTPSTDPNLRGLLVEVGVGGEVTNGSTANAPGNLVGTIAAERGNVTLAGLIVNQLGRVSATTTVRENGSIRLQARAEATALGTGDGATLSPSRTGPLTLGAGSITEISLAASNDTTVDVNEQRESEVRIEASRVDVLPGARVTAPSGTIAMTARSNLNTPPDQQVGAGDGRIYVASDAVLDVSGASIDLPMERNTVEVELRGTQLRDSPLQREGPLRGQSVIVDTRVTGTNADGTVWQGTSLGDASGEISNVVRDVRERNLDGGVIELQSAGDVIVEAGALLDVSGGSIAYGDGFVRTSQLLRADGSVVDVGEAKPDEVYTDIVEGVVVNHERWGITEAFQGIYGNGLGQFEAGYIEGRDAGTLSILAPRFALDGTLRATTHTSPRQRLPFDSASPAGPWARVPRGGELVLGSAAGTVVGGLPNFVSNAIRVEAGLTLATLRDAAGGAFDPLRDAWPEAVAVNRVRPELLARGGATRVSLFSNESVEVPNGVALDLGDGGSLALRGANVVLGGDVIAAGGETRLVAGPTTTRLTDFDAVIEGTATVDLRGRWINDHPQLSPTGSRAPLFISGGVFTARATAGDTVLQAGSVVDASGGAWRHADGRLTFGDGGEIELGVASVATEPVDLRLGGRLSAFSFANGGRLALEASSICIAAVACGDEPGELSLAPQLFDGGFADIALRSNLGGVHLTEGTVIEAVQQNWAFARAVALTPTGTPVDTFATPARLQQELRQPTHLTMEAAPRDTVDFTNESFRSAAGVTIGRTAAIDADAGSEVDLHSTARVIVDGTVRAPGGIIDLLVDTGASLSEYLDSQGVWLAEHGVLDVAGTVLTTPNDRGFATGMVLPGGSVSLRADRGLVATLAGSTIDVSGTAAELDVREGPVAFARRNVASAGGSIEVAAAEAALIAGDMRASGGAADVRGGSFSLTLDGNTRGVDVQSIEDTFPTAAREIHVTGNSASLVLGAGSSLSSEQDGRAHLAASLLNDAGFDSITLTSRNLATIAQGLTSIGTTRFTDSPTLAARTRLVIDSPTFASDGGATVLRSMYVGLGSTDVLSQAVANDLLPGTGTLAVEADAIELLGHARYQGFDRLAFTSRGDLRARGIVTAAARDSASGSLASLATIDLTAAQIYPTTLTRFTIQSGNGTTDGAIRTALAGERRPVLSAGGVLELRAPQIEHSGALVAPFGAITLAADELVLRPGSVVATSADGATIPFGTVQLGTDWTYAISTGHSLVFADDTLPNQQITLDSPAIDFQSGAVIDVTGGGDLLGYEWIPGVGGSRDALSPLEQPGTFAILPSLGLDLAPFDAAEYAAFDSIEYHGPALHPGDSVYLAGLGDLPAGTYQLLPARYALLPGAFLVTPVDGYGDMASSEQFARTIGGTVIAGQLRQGGRAMTDSRLSGFLVRRGTEALQRADYDVFRATELFTANAEREEVASPRLPFDAGRLSVLAQGSLSLAGTLLSAPATGGRGAQLEISGTSLRVASAPGVEAAPGEAVIAAPQVNSLGAASVLIGGTRTASTAETGATRLDVSATSVRVDPGVSLAAPEIMLVGRERVTVSADASLTATDASAANAPDLEVVGDAAFLRVANGPQVELARTDMTGAAGTLTLEAGSAVNAGGSAILSASRDMTSEAELDIGESLTIGASQITLGDVGGAAVPGIVLGAALLDRLDTLAELELNSASSVDLTAGLNFALSGKLRVDAAGLRVSAGQPAVLTAQEITLGNSAGRAALEPVASGGELRLAADRVSLDDGSFQLLGATRVTIDAPLAFFAAGDGALRVNGALDVATARVTADTGTDYTLEVGGALTVLPALRTVARDEAELDALGARLRVSADAVDVASTVELRAGVLDLTARGPQGIRVRDGTRLDLRGATAEFDGVVVGAPGGAVSLAAQTGGITIDAGAEVDVSAAAVGNAGEVRLTAPQGTVTIAGRLAGSAAAEHRGGTAVIDATNPGSLDGLASLLSAGNFSGGIDVRQRGAGDLTLSAGNVLRAERIALTADGGSVFLEGALDSNGTEGGDVTVAASGQLRVGSTISARGASGQGGSVTLLGGDDSSVFVDAAATIDVGGEGGAGSVSLRAPRAAAASLLDANSANDRLGLAGRILGADRIDLELYAATTFAGDRALASADVGAASPWFTDAATFMAGSAAIATALGRGGDANLRILPGVELRASGNLTLAADWNLYPWRFIGHFGQEVPGVLTLRAGGNLRFNNVLSDGFATTTGAQRSLLTASTDSWSYRLTGGADLASANPLAIVPSITVGDVTVGPGTATLRNFVRTGTGRIDVAAGRDVVLANQHSVIYTSGIATDGVLFTGNTQLGQPARLYPANGGDIAIHAQRDIVGARGNQLVTAWLWRVGQGAEGALPRATAWTVNFDQFGEGVGALGGGDIDVAAGGNIRDLSLVIPTIGRQVGGRTPAESVLEIIGGGDLNVAAGEDISGGHFYLGRGRGELLSRGDIGSSPGGRSPILALSDGTFELVARGDVMTSAVVDPMLLPQSNNQSPLVSERSHFISYAPTAGVSLTSVAGNAQPGADTGVRTELTSMALPFAAEQLALRLYPPSLRAAALRGDVEVPHTLTLTPAPKGNVELFASGDLRFASSLVLSDAERTALPTVSAPVARLNPLLPILGSAISSARGFNSIVPVHSLANQPDGVPDTAPARFVALHGNIAPTPSATPFVYLAKPGRFVAGRDISNLGLIAQNLTNVDATSLIAGRDISFPQQRVSTGSFERSLREIRLAGPGRLELVAGRDVTLGTSLGISTVGNLTNRALPSGGASVSITAGLRGGEANYAGMIQRYLVDSDAYDAQLTSYVSARSGRNGLTKAEALAAFRAFDRSQQAALMEMIFFTEVRDGGRAGASSENHDYGRAYTALATMFPGSDANIEAGEENPYAGDVSLFFSRAYTLAGGAIHFLAPGGAINAGIATPPSAFGLAKPAQELGVVAQRTGNVNAFAFSDFSVNESRVFSADGDDILVWSTWGDIDAGRGAKTAISAPPPIITFDEDGNPLINFPAALTGSGIQTLASTPGVTPGDVDLYAPQGIINAGDAGIRCNNCTFGATAVVGADNISIGGIGIGVAPDAGVNAGALTGVSAVASSAANAAEETAAPARDDEEAATPLADQALGFLDVFITGFGDPDAPEAGNDRDDDEE